MPTVKELHATIQSHNNKHCVKGYSGKRKKELVSIVKRIKESAPAPAPKPAAKKKKKKQTTLSLEELGQRMDENQVRQEERMAAGLNRAVTQTAQFRKDMALARRIRGDRFF